MQSSLIDAKARRREVAKRTKAMKMVASQTPRHRYFFAPLRLCAFALLLSTFSTTTAAEPTGSKLWPFRAVQRPAATSAPVRVAPASFQSSLPSPVPQSGDPFPLPAGAASPYDLY